MLCTCHGSLEQSLPVEEVGQFLQSEEGEVEVILTDDLCQPNVLKEMLRDYECRGPVVVGACSRVNTRAGLFASNSHPLRFVDLRTQIESSYSAAELIERAKLLLLAQVRRHTKATAIPRNGRKLEFVKPHGEISRRELFEMLMPEYRVMPFIESAECVGGERCRICQSHCTFGAVGINNGRVFIDHLRCRGCGTCAAVCPHRAITHPTFTFAELEQEMGGLLHSRMLDPRIIALVCQAEQGMKIPYPANVLPIQIPCLAMASPWFMLRAFSLGAQGLALISQRQTCQLDLQAHHVNVTFVQAVLSGLGINPERVRTFDANVTTEEELTQFSRQISSMPQTMLKSTEPTRSMRLPELISEMGESSGNLPAETITTGRVPIGRLALDRSRCTGCGLCARQCPTDALTSLPMHGEHLCQLLFHYHSCVGCGQCVESCPEQCLQIEYALDLSMLSNPSEMIFADRIVMCQECKAPVGPKAMIENLTTRIAAAGGITEQSFTCPECKVRTMSIPRKRAERRQ